MKMESVTISPITCKFSAPANKNEKELVDKFKSWATEKLFTSEEENQKLLTMVSCAIPQASTEFLLFASKTLFLEKLLQRYLENEEEFKKGKIEKLLETVQKIATDDWKGDGELSAIEKEAAEIVKDGKQLLNTDFEKRFLPKLISYLKALLELEEEKERGYVPSLTELLTLRHCASSTEMFIELCEAGMGLELSIENKCDSIIQRILKTVIRMSLIGKDLSNFEQQKDDFSHIVNSMKRDRNCGWQKALNETVYLYTSEQASLTALERLVDTDAMEQGKVVKKYLKMLKIVVKSMHEFHELSKEKIIRIA